MAVAVADGPEPPERTRPETGLLDQLPSCGRLGPLAGSDLAARELPEPAQEPVVRASLDEPSAPIVQHDDRSANARTRGGFPAGREGARVGEFVRRPAAERDRALPAPGMPREADGLPQFHHALDEGAGPVGR